MTKFIHSRPTHDVVCVLYATDTGKIVFTHRFTFLDKLSRPSDQQLEEETRQALQDHNKSHSAPQTTHGNLSVFIVPGENSSWAVPSPSTPKRA